MPSVAASSTSNVGSFKGYSADVGGATDDEDAFIEEMDNCDEENPLSEHRRSPLASSSYCCSTNRCWRQYNYPSFHDKQRQ